MKNALSIFIAIAMLLPGSCARFDNDLFDAINKNDIGSVDHMLRQGRVNVNTKDAEGRTPLGMAASLGEKDIVHLLITNGAHTEEKDRFGETPLSIAAMKGRTEVAHILVENKANVNAVNLDHVTPLMAACQNHHADVVKVLLGANADQTIKDENGETALDHAKRAGDQESIALLQKGQ